MIKNQMLLPFIKFLRLSNIIDVANNVYELNTNMKPIIKYKMRTFDITDPNVIVKKFESMNSNKWTYSDIFYKIDSIDGVSFDQEGKFAWVIDSNHGLEILQENIHYVKLLPNNIGSFIELLQDYHITFDVL